MVTIQIKGGHFVSATLVSAEDVELLREEFTKKGKSIDSCECSDELCIDGYIFSCSRDNDNVCRWFKTDWQCNL